MSRFVDLPFVLSNGDGQAGQLDQPVILYLTIAVSANATSHPILPINATNAIATEVDASPLEQATKRTMAEDSIEATPFVVATAPEHLSPPTDHVPIETSIPILPVPDFRVAMSPAEDSLRDADDATKAINLPSRWEGAVARIKWVMDTVSPAAEVRHSAMSFYLMLNRADFRSQLHPYAKMACSLLFAIPKVRRFALLSKGNADAILIWMLDARRTVSKRRQRQNATCSHARCV